MPELPEVETMLRGIRPLLEGGRLTGVSLGDCKCKPVLIDPEFPKLRDLCGAMIQRVRRRAKRIVIELSNAWTFVIEPRMTGLMLVDDPPDAEHLRFEWQVSRGRRTRSVWFWDRRGLGTIRLLNADQLEQQLGPHKLGPDALEMTLEEWQVRLSRTKRPIKVALLDQKLVAGIGNLYASEILHRCQIHPETAACTISSRRLSRLHMVMREILEEAIQHEGSTLSDGTYRNALNQNGGYQNMHRVYGHEGEQCPTCHRSEVKRIVQAQRGTFLCVRCQK